MNGYWLINLKSTTMKNRKTSKEEILPITEEEKYTLLSAYTKGININSDPKLQEIARKVIHQPPNPEISLRRKLDFIVMLIMVVIIAIVFKYYVDKQLPSLKDLLKPNT